MSAKGPDPASAKLAYLLYQKRIHSASGDGRESRTLSVREAAKQIGISAPTLSRIERGSAADIETLRKCCLWLDISADFVLGIVREAAHDSDARVILPAVQQMLKQDGIWIGGDTKYPDHTIPLAVMGGRVYSMNIDEALDPTRFLPTLTLKGPYRA